MNRPTGEAWVCALVPMKRFSDAKTRLRPRLDDATRAQLSRVVFERVLSAALACPLIDAACVLTNGEDVAGVAQAAGAEVLLDPPSPSRSLSELVDRGLADVAQRGATRAVVLMADLPRITERDVADVCAALVTHDVVAAPDRRGHSTNVLGVRLPFPIGTAFGHRDSYTVHRVRARAARLRLYELERAQLAHDLDLPEDLSEVALAELLRDA